MDRLHRHGGAMGRKLKEVYCREHPRRKGYKPMVCLACQGALGGQKSARVRTYEENRDYGRLGGRPKKQAQKKRAKKAAA